MSPKQPLHTPSMFEDVAEFHRQILNQHDRSPQMLDMATMRARMLFLNEEVNELREAVILEDIVGAADALADLVYVALGTAYLMGLPFDGIWAAVQKANMAKQPGMTKRGMANDAVKPEGWVGPEAEIQRAIEDETKS